MPSKKKTRGAKPLQTQTRAEWLNAIESDLFGNKRGRNSRARQLCRQVEEALVCALAASTSPVLRELYVLGVSPEGGAARLRVYLAWEGEGGNEELVQEALSRARGYLRSEVAQGIHRKRVPNLEYSIVPSF